MTTTEKGKEIKRYSSSACSSCAIKAQCTTGKQRRVSRWVREEVLERAENRLNKKPGVMLTRRSLVEHPFGTMNSWAASTPFLTRRLAGVSTEMRLQVLACNMTRAISLLGTQRIVATIRA